MTTINPDDTHETAFSKLQTWCQDGFALSYTRRLDDVGAIILQASKGVSLSGEPAEPDGPSEGVATAIKEAGLPDGTTPAEAIFQLRVRLQEAYPPDGLGCEGCAHFSVAGCYGSSPMLSEQERDVFFGTDRPLEVEVKIGGCGDTVSTTHIGEPRPFGAGFPVPLRPTWCPGYKGGKS